MWSGCSATRLGNSVLVHNSNVGGHNFTPAQQVASDAAQGFGNLQCVECAQNVEQALTAAGHGGQVIELRGGGSRGFIVDLSQPPNAPAISNNGVHVGVEVEGLVFDNHHS